MLGIGMTKEIFTEEFKLVGENLIDIDKVIKKWNHLWLITEWRESKGSTYRLMKYIRKDSPITEIKTNISKSQAKTLINKMGLVDANVAFRSGFSWRKQSDMDALDEWRSKKHGFIL